MSKKFAVSFLKTCSTAAFISVMPFGVLAQTPNPQAVSAGCPDNYGITVRGTNFAPDSYIEVREAGSYGTVIDSFITSDQLTRSTERGQNVLRFTVTNEATRQTLNNSGLWLWVVNPSAGTWNRPVAITRNAPSLPSMPIGVLTGTYGYDVQLQGTNFAADSYVTVRSSTGGEILQRYFGNQLTRSCSGGNTVLQLSISDATQQSYLNTTGLYFWVVNPSTNASNGPKQLVRSGFPNPSSSTYSAAKFISQSVLPTMAAGQTYPVSLTYQNTGTTTWTSADAYKLGSQNPEDNVTWGIGRAALPTSALPGQQVSFNFNVTAPKQAGAYNFQWKMVQEGIQWFGDVSPNVAVQVGAPLVSRRGGSNYNWYRVDYYGNRCNREPYGIIKNYHQYTPDGSSTVRSIVNNQLTAMYSSGQRRLRIAIFFDRYSDSGTIIQTVNGTLPQSYLNNLTNFLSDIKAAGFEEVIVGLFGLSGYRLWKHPTFDQVMLDEYWTVLQQITDTTTRSGIPYLIDLGNEMSPGGNYQPWLSLTQQIWARFVKKYGPNNTVGFSISLGKKSADVPFRLANIKRIYGNTLPAILDVHIYANGDEGPVFSHVDQVLSAQGLKTLPLIIGETNYNDTTTAASLDNAIRTTGRPTLYLLQWPKSRTGSQSASCDGQNVDSPLVEWSAYSGYGF